MSNKPGVNLAQTYARWEFNRPPSSPNTAESRLAGSLAEPETRAEILQTYGFTFYTDISNRIMENISELPVPEVQEMGLNREFFMQHDGRPSGYDVVIRDAEPDMLQSRLALYSVTKGLTETFIPNMYGIEKQYGSLGITKEDLQRLEKITAQYGLLDLRFTWTIAGMIASQCADLLVKEGFLTPQDVAEMDLADWGTIISRPWFSNLAHRMAMTGLGQYGARVGNGDFTLYGPNALLGHLLGEGDDDAVNPSEYLEVTEELEDEPGIISIKPTTKLISILGKRIERESKKYSSSGCPVARHSTRLPSQMLTEDPHTVSLIESGRLTVRDQGAKGYDRISVSQPQSAIDIQLALLGKKLINYHRQYGSPTYTEDSSYFGRIIRKDFARKYDESNVRDKISYLIESDN